MGKKISVASSVFNMAGPESQRPNYLKSLVFGAIKEGAPSLTNVITEGYLNSPAMRFRRFAGWAKRSPEFQDFLGITQGSIEVPKAIDKEALKAALPTSEGESARIEAVSIDSGDFLRWAQRWVAKHRPSELNDEWECEFDELLGKLVITFPDESVEVIDLVAPSFEPTARYLYVSYTPITAEEVGDPVVGEWEELPQGEPFPRLDGWQELERTTTPKTETLTRSELVEIFFDGEPGPKSSSLTGGIRNYNEIYGRYQTEEYLGSNGSGEDALFSERITLERRQTAKVEPRVTVTEDELQLDDGTIQKTVTTSTQDVLVMERSIRRTVQKVVHKAWKPLEVFIYKEGSGNLALDAFFGSEESQGNFYPPIPFRYNNNPIVGKTYQWEVQLPFSHNTTMKGAFIYFAHSLEASKDEKNILRGVWVDYGSGDRIIVEGYRGEDLSRVMANPNAVLRLDNPHAPSEFRPLPELPIPLEPTTKDAYKICKEAFKRAYGADYEEVLQQINANENIRSIDYAYAVFGVSLNVEENACRKYVYKFLQHLMTQSTMTPKQRADFEAQWQIARDSWLAWKAWRERQEAHVPSGMPGYNRYLEDPEPEVLEYPYIAPSYLHIQSRHKDLGTTNYRIRMEWEYINEERGRGVAKEGAKKGDLWFDILPAESRWAAETYQGRDLFANQSAKERNIFTLTWQDGEDTWRRLTVIGFRHDNIIYENKSVVIYADEALRDDEESGFIIPFHEDVYHTMSLVDRTQMATACCFLVFNCYEVNKTSFWEDWGAVILIVAFVVIAVVVTIATGGAGAGLLGSAASVGASLGLSGVAAIAIGAAANALAGLVLGFVLAEASTSILGEKWGRILGAVVAVVATMGLGSLSGGTNFFSNLLSPAGLIQLTDATVEGASALLSITSQEVLSEAQAFVAEREKETQRINKLLEAEFGKGGDINVDLVIEHVLHVIESSEDFMARTQMTGTDIAELQNKLIEHFAAMTVSLDLP